MKYYIIAGEASGDLHGSNLIRAIKQQDYKADIRCWGGDLMEQAGGKLVNHYKKRAFMGFLEVVLNLRKVLGFINDCKADIKKFSPDALVLIDNSGFNLRIAAWAKQQKLKIHYYISPQIWASRKGRIKKIKRDIDYMYVILPFEKEFYDKHNFLVHFVGHPLIDAIDNIPKVEAKDFRKNNHLDPDKPIIALLPGSRKQEVKKMLSLMLSVTHSFSEYQFVIAGAPSLDNRFYSDFLKNPEVKFVENKTYELLSISYAALVTSGTATLETALFNVPQVVCYKANWLSYQIAKRIITLDYISLVNLIMGREVVKELIQGNLNTKNIVSGLSKILDEDRRKTIFKIYTELKIKLGGKGASKKTAALIVKNV